MINKINLKEPRRSILILEAKYPVNAMNVEWSWYEKFGLNVVRTMDIEDIQSKLVAVPVRGHVNRADGGFLQYFGHSHGMIRRFLQP